jgi:long-chain acyl-CoA synthetase
LTRALAWSTLGRKSIACNPPPFKQPAMSNSPPETPADRPPADSPAQFRAIADLIRDHARARPDKLALVQGENQLSYAALDALMDRVAASLQRDGIAPREAIAICGSASPLYAAIFLGALRAGIAVAPLAPSVTPASFASMRDDAQARWLFVDATALDALASDANADAELISLDGIAPGRPFADWLIAAGALPEAVDVQPDWPFNIIYSSGTTGTPKGIVQSHGMRWSHVARGAGYGYSPDTVTVLATPLYSNTTLVVFFPTIAFGGTVVLMPKFDAVQYLGLAQDHHMTHTMLVPVQYQRIMAVPDFDSFDLSSTIAKFCTSAPFSAALKADVVKRWPGALVEYYGMTEGGGTCVLVANLHPDKLHTVGKPSEGHDIRLIDDDGNEVATGETGEVVGRSPAMMSGYHGREDATGAATWHDAEGNAFIRHGDIGRFDEDGFLILMDRKKDLIISGGFNIYPSDLEAILAEHSGVADCAVVGVPSEAWGETPVGFFTGTGEAAEILDWFNARVGKTQRLSALEKVEELPRNAIGKILKRELRDRFATR